MTGRLPAHLEAKGLLRQAEAMGGFGTIVRKGDGDRGAILLLVADRGRHLACLERRLGGAGIYAWEQVGPAADADPETVSDFSAKRVKFDEDLWIIELDTPQAERFIAETTAVG